MRWLAAAADAPALRQMPGTGHCELTVIFAGDGLLSALNAGFRGKQGPTNVLAFPGEPEDGLDWGDQDAGHLGDIAVSLETAQREADERKISLEAHLCHLTVHGLLHLLGYDHGNDHDADIMESEEKRILTGLGFGDPYADEKGGLARSKRAPVEANDG
jgi:probable rRNA maturation factor